LIRNAVRSAQWAQRGRESAVREPANPPLLLVQRDGRNGGQAQQYARILPPDAEHALSSRGRDGVNGAAVTVCGGGGAGSWRGMACSSIELRQEHCCPRRNGSSLFSCMHVPAPLRRS